MILSIVNGADRFFNSIGANEAATKGLFNQIKRSSSVANGLRPAPAAATFAAQKAKLGDLAQSLDRVFDRGARTIHTTELEQGIHFKNDMPPVPTGHADRPIV